MMILHIIDPGEVGGRESVVQALTLGQHWLGHGVSVLAVVEDRRQGRPFLTALREAGVEVFPLLLRSRGYLQERAYVGALCRRLRPAVVHTHGYRPDVVDAGVARRLGFPTVTTVHGFTGGDRKNRLYQWMQRAALRRFDAVVAVSRRLAEDLVAGGLARHRVHVLQNAWMQRVSPLDRGGARSQLGIPSNEFHIGWVGRLGREKGPDILVDSIRYLTDLPVRVSVLGDGRERAALQTRASGLGVADRFAWYGTVPEASSFFRAFDLFVLSSRTEGTPVVLFEAMAARVPIIATRVGGVPDILTPKEALLVPSEDPVSLAQAVRAVYGDPQAASARALAASERLEADFRMEPWLAGYDDVYRQVQRRET